MEKSSHLFSKGTLNIKWTEPVFKNKGITRCAVLIPVYKEVEYLSKFEFASIRNTVSVLGNAYEIFLVSSKLLETDKYSEVFGYKFSICKCSDAYFKSQKSYSDLCETYQFYDAFSSYEYILICQPDAWVFENRLEYFIGLGYDYIGSIHMLKSNGEGGRVGNGGFSLRKVSRFSEVCKETNFNEFRFSLLEDCAFSIRLKDKFKIATPEVGFDFGWQEQPQAAFEKTGKLPMGCHNPMRNNWSFWQKYIKISDEEFSKEKMTAISGAEKIFTRPKYDKSAIITQKKKMQSRPI